MSREEQLNAVKEIKAQLAKLTICILTEPEAGGSSEGMSEEEKKKLREQNIKAGKEREEAIQTIIAQINVLQFQRPLRPNTSKEEFVVINIDDLKQVQELAAKEKANETAVQIEGLITGSMSTSLPSNGLSRPVPRPQGGTRPPRPSRSEP